MGALPVLLRTFRPPIGDGAADDEITLRRNTAAFSDCDLVPSVLAGVETVDISTTLFGKRIGMPLFRQLGHAPEHNFFDGGWGIDFIIAHAGWLFDGMG